jgi:anti-sigma factor RsiW
MLTLKQRHGTQKGTAMSIDETALLAYADGNSSPDRMADVEAAIACSPELATRLAAMRASAVPYRAAFEGQPLPALPARLSARITHLIEADCRSQPDRRSSWPRLVAAFAAGERGSLYGRGGDRAKPTNA